MIRNKIILGKYTYIIEYYDAMESLTDEEHYDTFYLFKNQDFISETTIDKDIYIISEKTFIIKILYFLYHMVYQQDIHLTVKNLIQI